MKSSSPYQPNTVENAVYEGVLHALRTSVGRSRIIKQTRLEKSYIKIAATQALVKFYAESDPYPTKLGCERVTGISRDYLKNFLWEPLDKLKYV